MTNRKIRERIAATKARSAWDNGVKFYAEWLLDKYEEANGWHYHQWLVRAEDSEFSPLPLNEKTLLNGARDWKEYSWGGCAFVSNFDICITLATPSEQRRANDGERRPNAREEWLDVQARALYQAAWLILDIVNNGVAKL